MLLTRLEEPLDLLHQTEPGIFRQGSRPCITRSPGATTCWRRQSSGSSGLWRALSVGLRSLPLGKFAARQRSTALIYNGAPRTNLLDGITAIVEHSLLRQQEQADGSQRFAMLETIRHFGLQRLAEHGQIDFRRERHAYYFLEWVDEVYPASSAPNRPLFSSG